MMKVRSWPSLVLKSKTECFMVLSLQHHIPPFITSHSPLLFSFSPQEFSPKHTTAVEENPVHQASSDARAEDLSPAPHSPPHCKWEAAALITPGWTVGGKKKKKRTRHKRPDIARQWQFRSRISTAVISKLQWQSKLLVITKHTCIILILQCSCCVTQCFLIWTIKQVSWY